MYDVKPKAQSERCARYSAFAHLLPNCQLLYETAWNLKGSQKMGDGHILKNLRNCSFNKDLSNEPNFGQIHIAAQYLYR